MLSNETLAQAARDVALRAYAGYQTAEDVLAFLRLCKYVSVDNAALTEEGRTRMEFLWAMDNRRRPCESCGKF